MPQLFVTLTHGPETCAFTDPERRQRAQDAAKGLSELAQQQGIEVHAAFANVVEHRAFLYVDAPDTAAVERLLLHTHMFAMNTCRIEAVQPMSEVSELLEQLG